MKLFSVIYFTLTTFLVSVISQDILCNEDDINIIFNDVDFETSNVLSFEIATQCIVEVDFNQCFIDVLTSQKDLSSECSSCFATFTDCILAPCFNVCRLLALDQELCEVCIDLTACEFKLERCVGQSNIFQDQEFDTCLESPDTVTFAAAGFFSENLPLLAQQAFDGCSDFEVDSIEGLLCRKTELFDTFGGTISDDCLSCVETHSSCIANQGCSDECQSGDIDLCEDCVTNTICAGIFNDCSGIERYLILDGVTIAPTSAETNDFYEEGDDYGFEDDLGVARFFSAVTAFLTTFAGGFAAICSS